VTIEDQIFLAGRFAYHKDPITINRSDYNQHAERFFGSIG